MDVNTKATFISMFQLAEKGELDKLEQKDVITALMSYGTFLLKNKSFEEIQEEFRKIRIGSRNLLEQTETCIDTALETLKSIKDFMDKMQIDLKNLPEYAEINDDAKTLGFIKSLTKDLYNFSEAETLTGVTRQTLKSHSEKHLHGLRITELGKRKYLSKERLIYYYRVRFNDNGLPF